MEAPSGAAYADSLESSPRSRNTDSWDADTITTAAAADSSSKVRLMCSFNGHIVPRPHDKSLCYVGGETRMVVIDRNTPLCSLSSRLSSAFLHSLPFTLKYLLPSHDLDSLISVTSDEDLDNLFDEYDRISTTPSPKPSRIRLFLFPSRPNSVQSIPLLNSNTEDWFLGMLNRGFSDSGSLNLLMAFDHDTVSNKHSVVEGSLGINNNNNSSKSGRVQDVQSVPDSPMLETTSSFGSTSSSPSVANLPPIRVHVEEGSVGNRVVVEQKGIEDQFAQIGIGGGLGVKSDEGFVSPVEAAASGGGGVAIGLSGGEYQSRVVSNDERSEHGGVVGGFRKPPTPPPPQQQILHAQLQQQQKVPAGGGVDLPSPDSVSSDSSLTNAMLRPKPVVYQDQAQIQIPAGATRVPSSRVDPKLTMSDSHGRIQMQQQMLEQGYVLQAQFDQQQQQQQQQAQQQHQYMHATQKQVQEGGYVLQPQFDKQQQQFMHGTHFIQHAPSGAMPLHTFYSVYPPQQQQQQLHPQHHHQQVEQPYQIYYVPTRQSQPYNLAAQQPNISEPASTIPSSRAQPTTNPAMVQPSATYNPIRNAQVPQSEMTMGAYRTAISVRPQVVQVAPGQSQQQFVTYSQYHHPSQAAAPNSAAPASYAYEYADPAHTQIYFSQPLAPTMPSQYQTMTGATTAAAEPPSDSMKQQIRTSQPQ